MLEQSPRPQSRNVPVNSLDLSIESLQLPDQQVTTVKISSGRNGETETVETTDIPFACEIRVAGRDSREALGLSFAPIGDVSVSLSVEDGALKMSTRSTYYAQETHYKDESYNHRWVPEGQHYPYGPVEPGYMDYDTRSVPYTVDVRKEEAKKNVPVSREAFNAVYLGIVNAPDTPEKADLVAFLHQNFRDECQGAQASIKETLARQILEAQQRAQELASQLDGVSLPKL